MERTLQILSTIIWFSVMIFFPILGALLTLYLLFFCHYWYIVVVYLLWVYIVDRDVGKQGGRSFEWIRHLRCWYYFYNYFPLSLHKTADLAADQNYLLCIYPHGLLCSSAFGNFATSYSDFSSLFPNIKLYVTTINLHFYIPFTREILLGLGAVSVSRESIMYILNDKKKGKALTIVVGGAAEANYCHSGPYKIVLKNRKGFIKIALQTGTSLVPVFNFGETALYDQPKSDPSSWFYKIQNFFRTKFAFCPILPRGRSFFGIPYSIIPKKHLVATVVGKPIPVEKNVNPSKEQIDQLHETFTNELLQLFEDNKHKYETDSGKMKLIIL